MTKIKLATMMAENGSVLMKEIKIEYTGLWYQDKNLLEFLYRLEQLQRNKAISVVDMCLALCDSYEYPTFASHSSIVTTWSNPLRLYRYKEKAMLFDSNNNDVERIKNARYLGMPKNVSYKGNYYQKYTYLDLTGRGTKVHEYKDMYSGFTIVLVVGNFPTELSNQAGGYNKVCKIFLVKKVPNLMDINTASKMRSYYQILVKEGKNRVHQSLMYS
jgi:hypothetical protein